MLSDITPNRMEFFLAHQNEDQERAERRKTQNRNAQRRFRSKMALSQAVPNDPQIIQTGEAINTCHGSSLSESRNPPNFPPSASGTRLNSTPSKGLSCITDRASPMYNDPTRIQLLPSPHHYSPIIAQNSPKREVTIGNFSSIQLKSPQINPAATWHGEVAPAVSGDMSSVDLIWDTSYSNISSSLDSHSSSIHNVAEQQQQLMGLADIPTSSIESPLTKSSPSLTRALTLSQQSTQVNDYRGCKTLLHIAAENGHDHIVQALLKQEVDIDERDGSGATALHVAVRHQREGVVRLLLESGATVDACDNLGWTPLHFAAENGFVAGWDLLTFFGADLSRKVRERSGSVKGE